MDEDTIRVSRLHKVLSRGGRYEVEYKKGRGSYFAFVEGICSTKIDSKGNIYLLRPNHENEDGFDEIPRGTIDNP
ncbi:MAG: hypothetical protein ACE5J7_02400 [Candidatus Aenigmatarchaeota archaeon]